MNDSPISVHGTSCDPISGAHITQTYINYNPDNLNEKALPTSDLNTSCSSNKLPSPCSSSINEDRDDTNLHRFSKAVESTPRVILDNNESYSCRIYLNEDDALNSTIRSSTINPNEIKIKDNMNENRFYSSSEDDECRYPVTDTEELSDSILNDRDESNIPREQSSSSSDEYYTSRDSLVSDSEADGIVTFLDNSNNEVRNNK